MNMQLELYFAKQNTGSRCFMQKNVSLHHGEFSGVFLELINIYIVIESLVFIGLQLLIIKKVKLGKKKQKQSFANVLQIGFCETEKNSQESTCVVAGLYSATLLRQRPEIGVFLSELYTCSGLVVLESFS